MNNKEHVLLCIMGRTACGKDTLVNKLCERTGLKSIVSYTTRPQRTNEGDTHIFTTKEQYKQMKANGDVAAYTNIAGNIYWTTIDQLYENDVYIIDPKGVATLKKLHLPNLRIVTIFINTPDYMRKHRALNSRGDNKAKFRKRNFAENGQFRKMLKNANFDYSVSNVDFVTAYSCLRWIAVIEGAYKDTKEDATE